ncbi:hypothetical protein Z043_117674, partial [Scleropages formosus]
GVKRPQCVLCQEIFSNECMKPSKRKCYVQQKHPSEAGKSTDYFTHQELARAKKPHATDAALLLATTMDVVRELLGEEAARKVDCVPLSDNNTVSSCIGDMANDITLQLLEQVQ